MMSSALAMILMAAMAVPGNGPERVSGEVKLTDALDLRGGWEGDWLDAKNHRMSRVLIRSDRPSWITRGCGPSYPFVYHDDGRGKFQGELFGEKVLGIFRQAGNRLTLCYREASKRRPTDFQEDGDQTLLILHRVKPGE